MPSWGKVWEDNRRSSDSFILRFSSFPSCLYLVSSHAHQAPISHKNIQNINLDRREPLLCIWDMLWLHTAHRCKDDVPFHALLLFRSEGAIWESDGAFPIYCMWLLQLIWITGELGKTFVSPFVMCMEKRESHEWEYYVHADSSENGTY